MPRAFFVFSIVALLLFVSCFQVSLEAPPIIQRQMEIIAATIDGGDPQTVDPAFCYDTASGELLMNVYDTLVFFDGEHLDRYLPQLATDWSFVEHTPPLHDAETGLNWYYTYYFKIRSGVKFHNTALPELTPDDVEYCFERGMVLDMDGGPQWMFYEPLLNGTSHDYVSGVEYNITGNVADEILVGKMIDHAIESNASHVWFNLAYHGVYSPFLQILTQPWSSIFSKTWALSLGRQGIWPGIWGAYDGWSEYCNAAVPPLDDPTSVAMGTGPFVLTNLDRALKYWDANRFEDYWRGWGSGPAPNFGIGWPAFGGSKPAGYIDHYKVSWAWDWPTRSAMFLNGDIDFCAVPRYYLGTALGRPNVRCIYPLPSLAADALYYEQNINPTTIFGPILDYGVFNESGIPRDFFADVNIRKAFSHCINFTGFINEAYFGEAIQPPTAIIPGLPQYDSTIQKYDYDLAEAAALFQTSPCWTTGFTIHIVYNVGSSLMRIWIPENLASAINSLNPKFHALATQAPWFDYLYARDHKQLPTFTLGWLADYPDAHNFAYAFYHSHGNFAWRAAYSNPTMDALIESGIQTPDGPARNQIYKDIQQQAIDDCPCVTTIQNAGRHFELTWICGWYYNPTYSGIYAGNLWKWYYTPHAQLDTITNSTSTMLPCDVDYDGKTNMIDVGTVAVGFGAGYGPPIDPRWIYRCDFNNDRRIDMKDLGIIAKNFGKTSVPWTPQT